MLGFLEGFLRGCGLLVARARRDSTGYVFFFSLLLFLFVWFPCFWGRLKRHWLVCLVCVVGGFQCLVRFANENFGEQVHL